MVRKGADESRAAKLLDVCNRKARPGSRLVRRGSGLAGKCHSGSSVAERRNAGNAPGIGKRREVSGHIGIDRAYRDWTGVRALE
jgi:hypothetical protein